MGENRQKPLSERVHISECSTGVRAEIRELEARVEQAECLVAESDRVLGEIMLELTGDEALADNPVEYIRELSNGREQAERERDKWRIAMENLTPGGSEYYNDLERCVAVIRERFDRKSKLIRTAISRRKQAERENDNLQEQIAYLSKRCAVLTDERNAAQAELSRALDEIKILIAPHEVGGGPVAMLKQRVAELEHAIDDVRDLIDESDGVYGLHENGDLAPWDELRGGGKFECWLGSLDAAPAPAPEWTGQLRDVDPEGEWRWWRPSADDAKEVVYIERSGHKPPYWNSWTLCSGCTSGCADECCMALDLNHDGDGPVEEGYEGSGPFRGGEWSTRPFEKVRR